MLAMGEKDQSGQALGWTGYTWNKLLFPDPDAFLKKICMSEGLKTTLNLHPASGIQPWEAAYPAMARAMGIDPATKKYVPFDIDRQEVGRPIIWTWSCIRWRSRASISGGWTGSRNR